MSKDLKLAGGMALGGAAGYAASRIMNQSKKDRLSKLKEKALNEQEDIKKLKGKRLDLKIKGGLSLEDIQKIKDHKKEIQSLKQGRFTTQEKERVEELNRKIYRLNSLNNNKKNLGLKGKSNTKKFMRGVADVGTDIQTDRYKREISSIQSTGENRGRQMAQDKLKKVRQLESKLKLSPEDKKEYLELKSRLKKGNLSQKEANNLKSKINTVAGVSSIGGALLGLYVGSKI